MKYTFPDNFWWGSASSALQTEALENGHSAVKAAEPQQLSYLD